MVQSIDDARRRSQRATAGRVPPYNLSAEESLLGAMLLSRDAIAAAVETCAADDFYKPAHAHIFDAICALYGQGEPADPVTVADELRRADLLDAISGAATLTSLQANTPATANAGRYGRIVEEHALLRRLIGVANEIAELGYSVPEDVAAVVDRAESMVFQVAERRVIDTLRPLHDLLSESLDRLEALYDRGEAITGVPTGYVDLDERLSGLQPSNLIIVGARPAMGKTSFGLGLAAHAAMEARLPVLYFSLEMSHPEITQRLLCSEARVDSSRIRNGRLLESDWPKISHAIGRLGEAPLYIDDNPNLSVMEIRAKARRLKSRLSELGVIIVDYLQLMSTRSNAENRQVEVSEISRGLKILARELEVPVVALSQLSRNLEMRADKRPVLADLRESGCMPASTKLLRADNGEAVTLGDLVLTQEQPEVWSLDANWRLVPRRVLRAFPSGIKPVYRLRLASGLEVEATGNHRFRTIEGWVRLDELSEGDFIAVPRQIPSPLRTDKWDDDSLRRVKPNPNVDLIPWGIAGQVKWAMKEAGVSGRSLASQLSEGYSGSYLLGDQRRPRRFSRGRLARIAAILGDDQLAALATSGVFWDEIVERTPLGLMPTFDATVEDTHNFVANGVIAHNSLEQDADVVMFLYRDEVYNPESPDRGTAEVILSKHRNGPTGVTQLAFLDHYTRFANMARV
jgi:replicative DNA helicase